MSVTVSDVMIGFRAKWVATVAITSAITGGLHEGDAPEGTSMPYASMACTMKERLHFSGASIETFTLTVKVYVSKSAVTAGQKLAELLTVFDHKDGGDLTITPASGTAIHMDSDPQKQDLTADPSRLDAEKVLIALQSWDIILDVRP